jgi:hypothetical protein
MTLSYLHATNSEKHIYDFPEYNFKLKMERKDHDLARIYFLDSDNNIIAKPPNIRCVNKTLNTSVPCDNLNKVDCYLITWFNNYNIFYDDRLIKIISNKRQQLVTNPINENIKNKKPKNKENNKKWNNNSIYLIKFM